MQPDHIQNMKMKTLLQRIGLRDPEPDPPLLRGLQKSEPLTSRFSPGSHLNSLRIYSSLPVKNSQELTRKMVQNHALDFKLTKLRVLSIKRAPEFPDMEWNNVLARKSVNLDAVFTGMYSTATDRRTIENLGKLEHHFRADKPAKSVETHGDWVVAWVIAFWATKFIFPTERRKLRNTPNTSLPTSHPYTPALIGKYSSSTKPSINMLGPLMTSPLTSSANSDTSRLVTSMGMALVKAVLNPSRKRLRNPELEPLGDRLPLPTME